MCARIAHYLAGRPKNRDSIAGRDRHFCAYHQWIQGPLSLGIKRLGREVNHSPPCTIRVQEWWSCTSNSPYIFMSCFLTKHRTTSRSQSCSSWNTTEQCGVQPTHFPDLGILFIRTYLVWFLRWGIGQLQGLCVYRRSANILRCLKCGL
jgi:hypothetical protein